VLEHAQDWPAVSKLPQPESQTFTIYHSALSHISSLKPRGRVHTHDYKKSLDIVSLSRTSQEEDSLESMDRWRNWALIQKKHYESTWVQADFNMQRMWIHKGTDKK